jgi:ribonuclease HI
MKGGVKLMPMVLSARVLKLAVRAWFYVIIMGVSSLANAIFLPTVSDPERAELISCKRALALAKGQGWEKVCLETDCVGVVTKLTSNEMD